MWQLVRPDAVNALESEQVKKALSHYKKILEGKERAKFIIAKESNLLEEKIKEAKKILECCELCERKCKVNRLKGEKGSCRAGNEMLISSAFVHIGEEAFFVPSFTIFFMGCTFTCVYCQNWEISQWYEQGRKISPERLAELVDLNADCRNINFVGGEPTPYLPFILETLSYVKSNLPVIWNSNFYMSEKALKLLSGIIDVYLSDWKYGSNECAKRLSKVDDYWEIVKRNHDFAFRDAELVIRHLILPNHFECCTKRILEYIAQNYGEKVIVNLMPQYRPEYLAKNYPDIARLPKEEELRKTWELAEELGLNWMR
jgi:putative pyruvate formate lyase activating enzyme